MIRRFARPYARAIMDVVQSPEKANAIRHELERFESVRKSSSELQELYANPGIEHEAKMKVTTAIAGRLGLSDMTTKLLGVLISNRRMNNLQSMIEALAEMVREATNTVAAEVRAAHKLTPDDQAQLRRTLEKKAGKNVEMTVTTDPTLIGGFVAKLGSEVYDASVLGKIDKFRESLG
ncbi:MAG TPA: ATP synthase F1 subunit delta [Thermoanaerobaculia bacterium]|nr:ATP synthase F1 subunit delta [Thermoanaerobaculia bacterium]